MNRKEYTPQFEQFWKAWQGRWDRVNDRRVKVGKFQAAVIWKSMSPQEREQAVKVASRARGQFVPDAWKWLANKRFDDYE